jgi:hypothetical protein
MCWALVEALVNCLPGEIEIYESVTLLETQTYAHNGDGYTGSVLSFCVVH